VAREPGQIVIDFRIQLGAPQGASDQPAAAGGRGGGGGCGCSGGR